MSLMRIHARSAAAALLLVAGAPARAQWLDHRAPGIPRTADGKPNLSAPAPKTAGGKPDLSGVWDPGRKYIRDIAVDLKEVPFQPWAEKVFQDRATGAHSGEESDANCLPQGVPKLDAAPAPWKIVQLPGEIAILYEAFTQFRQIFMDGRPLPQNPNPSWLGYSVGRWEGDTLVVETVGLNGKTWLDQIGHPTTEALHVTERFRRKDFGHMELQITIDDPKAYTKPWTVTESPVLTPDDELLEFVCNENNRDVEHLPGK